MNLSTKVAYNTIIQFTAKILSTILGFITIAIIARYLGLGNYGEYTTAITFISFFAIVADMGLTLVTVQLISQPDADEERILANLLGLRLTSALILIGLAPIFILFFPYSTSIKQAVLAVSFSFFFIALNQVLVGLFQKRLRMDKVSIAEVLSRLLLLWLIIYIERTNRGLMGVMLSISVSSAFNFVLHFLFSFQFARLRLRFEFRYWLQIMQKSWPLALTIILNLLYLKTDTLLLSIIDRPTEIGIIEEVGLYGMAYKVIEVLITLPFMFAGIVLPILTFKWASRDTEGFGKVLQKSFDLMAIFALPIAFGTQIVSRQIMTLVGGPAFAPSGTILNTLIIASSIIFLGTMFSHAVIAIDKQKRMIPAYIFVALSSVIGYFLVIPHFSYIGAAWVTVYSETTIAFMSFYVTWKYTRFIPDCRVFCKALLSSVLMVSIIFGLEKFAAINLYVTITCASLFYIFFMYLTKGLSREDILILLNRKR